MFSELLTIRNNESIRKLLGSYPHKPFNWAITPLQQDSLIDYFSGVVARVIENGGVAKTYVMGGELVGLCTSLPDKWASRELGVRTYHINHLLASGSVEAQTLIKGLLVRETTREIGNQTNVVARIPYTDVTSIKALENMGFEATQTSLVLAKDLEHAGPLGTELGDYEVRHGSMDDVELVIARAVREIPEGILGWDVNITDDVRQRVYLGWLRSYRATDNLLLAYDGSGPIGLIAKHIRGDTSGYLGFTFGSIDLVVTAPEYRGNGVVPRLMNESLLSFRNAGVRLAEVVAYSSDAPVVRFCQDNGFAAVESTLILTNLRN